MSARDRANSHFLEASEDHSRLIDRIEEMTADLMLAIDSWDVDKAVSLTESRAELCSQISESIQRLALLDPIQRQNASAAEWAGRDAATQRIHERQRQMMDQQAKAEEAMAAELQRRRSELTEMKGRRLNQGIYHRSNSSSRYGRFLDSKI